MPRPSPSVASPAWAQDETAGPVRDFRTYGDNTGAISESETRDGFRVSGGGEIGSGNFFGRLELRYQDLGDFTVFGVPTGFARTNTQIVAGIGIRL